MATRKIRSSWWVDFSFNHNRYRVRSPENSKTGAQAYEAALRQKLARGESLAGPDKKEKEREQLYKELGYNPDTYSINKPFGILTKSGIAKGIDYELTIR